MIPAQVLGAKAVAARRKGKMSMDKFELACAKCGTRYRLLRRPAQSHVQCRKCGATITVDLPPAERSDRSGQAVGGYTILKLVSRGPSCDVYRAEQVMMRRTVALKMLGEEFAGDTATVDDFLAHARMVAAMQHPAISSIYDVNVADVPYFSMEFVEGSTAAAMLQNMGCPPVPDALRIGVEAGAALAQAVHSGAQSVHMTGDSLMLTDKGEVKILPSAFSPAPDPAGLTADDSASCALGLLMYLLLTGQEADPQAKSLSPPAKLNPAVPAELDAAVMQMLKGKKGYPSAGQAVHALKRLAGDSGPKHKAGHAGEHSSGGHHQPHHTPLRYPTQHNKTALIAFAAMILLAVAVVATVLLISGRKRDLQNRFDSITRLHDERKYEDVIRLGDQFIKDYPTNPSVASLQTWIDDSKVRLQLQKRGEELAEEFRKIYEAAKAEPYLFRRHLEQVQDLQNQFADMPGIALTIRGYEAEINGIWAAERQRILDEVNNALREDDLGQALSLMAGVEKTYRDAGLEDTDQQMKYIKDLQERATKKMNDKFYALHNDAFTLEQQNKIDEAISLYQQVVDKWGVPDLVERAKENLERLKAKVSGRPAPTEAPAPTPPPTPTPPDEQKEQP